MRTSCHWYNWSVCEMELSGGGWQVEYFTGNTHCSLWHSKWCFFVYCWMFNKSKWWPIFNFSQTHDQSLSLRPLINYLLISSAVYKGAATDSNLVHLLMYSIIILCWLWLGRTPINHRAGAPQGNDNTYFIQNVLEQDTKVQDAPSGEVSTMHAYVSMYIKSGSIQAIICSTFLKKKNCINLTWLIFPLLINQKIKILQRKLQ